MPISDLCTTDLVCIEKDATLKHASQLMKKHHVGGLVVVEANNKSKPVGILTDRDIVLSVVAENLSPNMKVQDIMTKELVKVHKKEGISKVIEIMEDKAVRRMIVVDEAGNACGLVSSDDILQLVSKELNGLGRLVQKQLKNEKKYKPTLKQAML